MPERSNPIRMLQQAAHTVHAVVTAVAVKIVGNVAAVRPRGADIVNRLVNLGDSLHIPRKHFLLVSVLVRVGAQLDFQKEVPFLCQRPRFLRRNAVGNQRNDLQPVILLGKPGLCLRRHDGVKALVSSFALIQLPQSHIHRNQRIQHKGGAHVLPARYLAAVAQALGQNRVQRLKGIGKLLSLQQPGRIIRDSVHHARPCGGRTGSENRRIRPEHVLAANARAGDAVLIRHMAGALPDFGQRAPLEAEGVPEGLPLKVGLYLGNIQQEDPFLPGLR